MTDSTQLRNAIYLLKTLRQPNPIGGFPRGRERELFKIFVSGLNTSLKCAVRVNEDPGSDIDFAHANYTTIFELRRVVSRKRLETKMLIKLTVKPPLFGCTRNRRTCIRRRDQLGNYCNICRAL